MQLDRGTRDGLDATGHPRQVVALPRGAAVVGAEDLSLAGAEVHRLRVAFVDRDSEGGAGRLDALVEAAPGLTSVGGAENAALFAAEVKADAGIQRAGVVGGNLDAAGVADVGEVLELEVVPGLSRGRGCARRRCGWK